MKTFPPQSQAPSTKIKKDPFQRLSLAVKKLDQLITRANQLGSLTDQFLRDDNTNQRLPYPEISQNPHRPSDFAKKK